MEREVKVFNSDEFELIEEVLDCLEESGQLTTTEFVESSARKWFCIFDEENLIAFSATKNSDVDEAEIGIGYTYVKPEYRKQGILKTIINAVYSEVKDSNFTFTTFCDVSENILNEYNLYTLDSWTGKNERKITLYGNFVQDEYKDVAEDEEEANEQ